MPTTQVQNGIGNSDRGNIRRIAADRAAIQRHAMASAGMFALPRKAGLIVASDYPDYEGVISNGPHLRIGLCVGRGAQLCQDMEGTRVEGVWRTGALVITPPDRRGMAASAATSVIGLAILPEAFPIVPALNADHLDQLSRSFQRDALLATVMTALLTEAETHGTGDAFIEHGVTLLLRRLSELSGAPTQTPKSRPLSQRRYGQLKAYVDAHLAGGLSVSDMAAAIGMDPSGFNRALRARIGLPAFAWLTQYRMAHAAILLTSDIPIAQVAARVGYANPGKFAAAFRRVRGSSPSSWRNLSK